MTARHPRLPRPGPAAGSGTVLLACPSADAHDSALATLATAAGLIEHGRVVVAAVPAPGDLADRLGQQGVEVIVTPSPALRSSEVDGSGPAPVADELRTTMQRMQGVVRAVAPAVLCAPTVTVPWWLAAARSSGIPSLCLVRAGEAADPLLVRVALGAPQLVADVLVVDSHLTGSVVRSAMPGLTGRTWLVPDGVRGPGLPPHPREQSTPYRLLVTGQQSPRSATHVALEALARLRCTGLDVVLEVRGRAAPGHEAYATRLAERARQPDLRGSVTFTAAESSPWAALRRADAYLAPSPDAGFDGTSFRSVVEAQLARRPVGPPPVRRTGQRCVTASRGCWSLPATPRR